MAKKLTAVEICSRIEGHMEDPEYVKAMYEFIRRTTSWNMCNQ